jgi:hypothetical protein
MTTIARVRKCLVDGPVRLLNVQAAKSVLTISDIEFMFENKPADFYKTAGLFDESVSVPKTMFNDRAKNVVNATGEVYDILSMVAIIAMDIFKCCTIKEHGLRKEMTTGMKLVFKGGASIGKYLLVDTESAFEYFIKGGDNDTCIVFSKVDSLYSPGAIHAEQRDLLKMYMRIVYDVVRDYQIEQIISPHIQKMHEKIIQFGDDVYVVRKGKMSSFEVVTACVVEDEVYQTRNTFLKPTHIYNTLTSMDFAGNGLRAVFHLGRIKAAFVVTDCNDKVVKINSELLDVAVLSPFASKESCTYRKVKKSKFF